MLPFPEKNGLLLWILMHKLACLGIQTSRRFLFYSDSLKMGERVNSEIWGSPGSRQLLQLQHFSKNSKNFLDPPLLWISQFFSWFLAYGFWSVFQYFGLLSFDWFFLSSCLNESHLYLSSSSFCISFKAVLNWELSHWTLRRCRRTFNSTLQRCGPFPGVDFPFRSDRCT